MSTIARILILFTQMSTYVQPNLASILVIDNIRRLKIIRKEVIALIDLGQQYVMVESSRETEKDSYLCN